jgi:L-asparagine oxygenase
METAMSQTAFAIMPPRPASDAAIHWLFVPQQAAIRFARLSEPMKRSEDGADQNPRPWLDRALLAARAAMPSLTRLLGHARADGQPVIVVRGLAVDPGPPATPYDGAVDPAASSRSIINLHAVAAVLGLHPIAYAGESASILHAVCPVRAALGEASSHGFDTALPFHTDYADRPIDVAEADQSPAASALIFAVEHAEPAIPMECVPLCRLLEALTPEQIHIGRQAEFAVRAPAIFRGGQIMRRRRLFLGDGRCRLNLGRMTGITTRAARLLDDLRSILADEAMVTRIPVRRGDIVVIDNQRAVHRRAAFTPRWDGTDRYFIRMSAVPDPARGIAADSSHPWIWS